MVGRLSREVAGRRRRRERRAAELSKALGSHGILPVHPVDVNLVFLDLDPECAAAIADWAPASLWDRPGSIRFAASWDTDAEDVQRLARGVIAAINRAAR